MTTPPRTRTRPAHRAEVTETRATGSPVAEVEREEHAPAKSMTVFRTPIGGLVARISVRDGVTLNMGNYNSFRRDVGLELDIPMEETTVLRPDGNLTQEAIDKLDVTYQSVQDFVSDLVAETVADARAYFAEHDA